MWHRFVPAAGDPGPGQRGRLRCLQEGTGDRDATPQVVRLEQQLPWVNQAFHELAIENTLLHSKSNGA